MNTTARFMWRYTSSRQANDVVMELPPRRRVLRVIDGGGEWTPGEPPELTVIDGDDLPET